MFITLGSAPMKYTTLAIALTVAAIAATNANADIRVVNELGDPIPKARVLILLKGQYGSHESQAADENGVVSTSNLRAIANAPTKVKVIATAPGYAWATLDLGEMENPSEADATITIPEGREITVQLKAPEDRPLPDNVVPFVFGQETMGPIFWGTEGFHTLSKVEPMGDGRFSFHVPKLNEDPIFLGINDPEYLLGWVSKEPVDTQTWDKIIELPKPGSALVRFKVPDGMDAGEITVEIGGSISLPGGSGGIGYQLYTETLKDAASFEHRIDNLAPGGRYSAEFYAGTPMTRWNIEPSKAFHERKQLVISEGEVTEVASTYKRFDKEALKGDATATVTLTRPDGSPAAGVKWKLKVQDTSLLRPAEIASGVADENGVATITELKSGEDAPNYVLVSDSDEDIGRLEMKEKQVSATMSMPPEAGDIAPDVTLVSMSTGENVKLSDYRGQVLFLDFWATWCGPCQEPMQHNSDILKRRAADWNGKAAILAISCDDEIETLKKHVADRGWDNVTHLWCEEGGSGWKATAMRTYVISGVPTAFLVDQEGKIVWRGHPATFKVEERIDALIKQKEKEVASSTN
jgi:peroxiredoxin